MLVGLRLILLFLSLSLGKILQNKNEHTSENFVSNMEEDKIGDILLDTANQYSYLIINYSNVTNDIPCSDKSCLTFNTNMIQEYTKDCGIELSLIDLTFWTEPTINDPVIKSLPFIQAEIVFLVSNNNQNDLTPFYDGIRKIGQRLNEDLNPWLTWTPLFFIIWPTLIEIQSNNISNLCKTLESKLRDETEPLESNVSFPLDSDVFIIVPTKIGVVKQDLVFEIYTQGNNLILREVVLPIHSSKIFSNYLSKSERRRNFNMAQIRAVAFSDPDYSNQIKFKQPLGMGEEVEFESGVSLNMFFALKYSLNFSHIAVQGDGWMEQLENGTWIGMGKQLTNNEADIAISFSMSLPDRLKGFDFLHPVSYGSIKAFFRQPDINTFRDVFILPFKSEMWLCLLIFWIVVILSLRLLILLRERQNVIVDYRDRELMNESMLWIVSTVCMKGWHITPVNISMMIIFACGSFTGLLYSIAYSASLVSTLAIEVKPIKTLVELAQSELELLGDFWLPNSAAIVQELEGSRIKQYPSYRKPLRESQFLEIDHAIPKIMSTPSTFLTFSDGFLTVFHRFNYTDNLYCDLFSSISVSQAPLCSGFIVKKGSHYKEFFNAKIIMIQERGVSFRNNQIYFKSTSARCMQKSVNHFDLGLTDLFTAFLILLIGLGFSLAMLILENLLGKCNFDKDK